MAVTTTTRMGVTRWSAGTDPFTRAQMDATMAALEAKTLIHSTSTAAARPAAGVAGRFHYASDTAAITYDNGTAWSVAVVLTNDARLTDARTPTAHVHAAADTTSGTFPVARIGTGTAAAGKYVDGATGAWTTLPAGNNTLSGLTDVTITAAATGDVLRHNGTAWVDAILTKTDVGLALVDNTADTAKPVSTAQATAIGLKADSARSILAGTGLTGGGTLAADRTLTVAYGATSTTACVGNDDRLSDARVPTAHAHPASDVTSGILAIARIPTAADGAATASTVPMATDLRLSNARVPTAHVHAQADVTSLTTDLAAKAPTSRLITAGTGLTGGGDLTANRTLTVAYGTTASTAAQGNDARLSDARTPTAHAHPTSDVTGLDTALAAKAGIAVSTIAITYATAGTGAVTPGLALSVARKDHAATVVAGKVHVLGGHNSAGSALAVHDFYDPGANTWTSKTSFTTSRAMLAAVTQGGLLWLSGGTGSGGGTKFANFDSYDVVTNAWTSKTAKPEVRYSHGLAAVGQFIYSFGGGSTSSNTAHVRKYDVVLNTWSALADMSANRTEHAAIVDGDGLVHLIGGNSPSSETADHTVFDPATSSYVSKAPLPAARGRYTGCNNMYASGRVWVVGGANGGFGYNTMYSYSPITDVWTTLSAVMNPLRRWGSVTAVGTKLVCVGGVETSASTGTVDVSVYDILVPSVNPIIASLANPGLVGSLTDGLTIRNGRSGLVGASIAGKATDAIYPYGPTVDAASATTIDVLKIGT